MYYYYNNYLCICGTHTHARTHTHRVNLIYIRIYRHNNNILYQCHWEGSALLVVHRYPHHPEDPRLQNSEGVGEGAVIQALMAQLQDNNDIHIIRFSVVRTVKNYSERISIGAQYTAVITYYDHQ